VRYAVMRRPLAPVASVIIASARASSRCTP
jgi:hypothetical protein